MARLRSDPARMLRIAANAAACALHDLAGTVPPSPLMIYVELTRRCNLKCRHCDIWMTASRRDDLDDRELPADRLVSILTSLVPKGLIAVDLFGGEPLLRPDLPCIVRGLTSAGLHVTVTTNGWLLADALSRQLIDAGLRQLLVSVDAPTADLHDLVRGMRGAYARVIGNLERFRHLAAGTVSLGLNTLVARPTIRELPDMVDLASRLGARQLRLLPYHQCYPFTVYRKDDSLLPGFEDLPALKDALAGLQRKARAAGIATNGPRYLDGIERWYAGDRLRARCTAGVGVCDINALGDVYPCYSLGSAAGSLWFQSFEEIWHGDEMGRHRHALPRCRRCWQSCYIEPALRLSPWALWKDRDTLVHDVKEYLG